MLFRAPGFHASRPNFLLGGESCKRLDNNGLTSSSDGRTPISCAIFANPKRTPGDTATGAHSPTIPRMIKKGCDPRDLPTMPPIGFADGVRLREINGLRPFRAKLCKTASISPITPQEANTQSSMAASGSILRRGLASAAHGVLVLSLTALITVLLVRVAPGFGIDERIADATLGTETRNQLSAQAWSGWGTSSSFGVGVEELIKSRWLVTARLVAGGLIVAWAAAFLAVLAPFLAGRRRWSMLPDTAAVLLLAIPTGLLSLAAFLARQPVEVAVGAALFPRIYLFLRNRFDAAAGALHVTATEARGVPPVKIALRHILRPELGELCALGAVSLKAGLSAAIPAEVLGDVPGLGQAVWKAAQGRDLALILPLTLLFAGVFQVGTWLASLPSTGPHRRSPA